VSDLAVEVLSKSNTKAEMDRKLRDYFAAGVSLIWYIDPKTRSARAFTTVDESVEITEGGNVLSGLIISLRTLFAKANRSRPS